MSSSMYGFFSCRQMARASVLKSVFFMYGILVPSLLFTFWGCESRSAKGAPRDEMATSPRYVV